MPPARERQSEEEPSKRRGSTTQSEPPLDPSVEGNPTLPCGGLGPAAQRPPGPALPKSYVPQQVMLCLAWGGHLVLLECIPFHGEKTQPLPSRGSWAAGETDTHHSDCKSLPAAQVLASRGYLFILDSSVSSGPLRNIYKSPGGIKISVLLLD